MTMDFDKLQSIPYSGMTSDKFCDIQPCVNTGIGAFDFTLIQPTSTIIVYVLSLLWVCAGLYFWRIRDGHKSRLWWSIALVLGGVAAFSAGTSYQAFGYEIKCAGREICAWTSWWEVVYLLLQATSMDAMIIAVAYSCTTGNLRKGLIVYAVTNALVYFVIIALGSFSPSKFMISFELLIIFSAPNLVLFFAICGWRYYKYRSAMDYSLLMSGILLVATTCAYFLYYVMDITQVFWKKGIWFSENDVLHILMIGWITYVVTVLSSKVVDE